MKEDTSALVVFTHRLQIEDARRTMDTTLGLAGTSVLAVFTHRLHVEDARRIIDATLGL